MKSRNVDTVHARNSLFPVTLILPYTDPIDWDRFQEKVRAVLVDCRTASGDLGRRPRFAVILKPVGVKVARW